MKYLVLVLLFASPVFGQKKSPASPKNPVPDKAVENSKSVDKPLDKPDAAWEEEYQQAAELSQKIAKAKNDAGITHLENLLTELTNDLVKRMGPDRHYEPATHTFVANPPPTTPPATEKKP